MITKWTKPFESELYEKYIYGKYITIGARICPENGVVKEFAISINAQTIAQFKRNDGWSMSQAKRLATNEMYKIADSILGTLIDVIL